MPAASQLAPSITTPKSLLFGFGFEAISTADAAQPRYGPDRVLPVAVDARAQPAAASAAAGPPALSSKAAQRNLSTPASAPTWRVRHVA